MWLALFALFSHFLVSIEEKIHHHPIIHRHLMSLFSLAMKTLKSANGAAQTMVGQPWQIGNEGGTNPSRARAF